MLAKVEEKLSKVGRDSNDCFHCTRSVMALNAPKIAKQTTSTLNIDSLFWTCKPAANERSSGSLGKL